MKKHLLLTALSIIGLLTIGCLSSLAQSPGLIVRPAGGTGPVVLNPNQDNFTSATTAGFTSSDISQSEILYKIIPPLLSEPTGDLATGPSGGYSDIVKAVDESGCYMYNDGTNLLFRLRIGGIVNGGKAYNILIDTDNKLGATGPNADPNYVAPTNSGNGNPGFEIEIAYETGVGVVLYNVNGITNPSPVTTYGLSTNSLISVALSRESGDADYFYDFFVPLSALNSLGLTAATPFRIVVTTNTNPGSAFQGTRSDIYGINDALFPNTTDAWSYVGTNTPPITLTDLTSGGSGYSGACTAAPVVTAGFGAGTNVVVSGTWTRMDATKPSTATITIYKNGVSQGTTTCSSGSTWNFTVGTIATGDVISAKAQASGESMCLLSNSVAALTCSAANISSTSSAAFGACVNNQRGMAGTKVAGSVIKIYKLVGGSATALFATDGTPVSPSTYNITYSTTTTWEYNGANNGGSVDPCSGGANDIPNGSYYITVTEAGKCESAPIWGSCVGSSIVATATPVITQTVLYSSSTTVSGTAVSGATVRLYINGFLKAETTATGGSYSFTGLTLQTSDVINVRAQSAGDCSSSAASLSVSCYTAPPIITTDAQGQLTAGATTVSGTSSEPVNTNIRVYASPATLVGSTTVAANGTWSATVTALVSGTAYYAVAQNGSCTVSANSANATARVVTTACPTISGTYAEGASPVTGTFASSFTGTVYLYEDGSLIGSAAVSGSTNWSVTISSPYSLYAGGVLTAAAQATNGTLNKACATTTTVTCAAPAAPSVSPTSSTISAGSTVTYTVSNTVSGVLYIVQDASSGATYATSKFGDGTSQTFTTTPFSSMGTYNLYVTADKLTGSTCKTSTSVSVNVAFAAPVTWVSFTGKAFGKAVRLEWKTASEQNTRDYMVQYSLDGLNWSTIGSVTAAGNSDQLRSYVFDHGQPATGVNYYRLVQRDIDNKINYSRVLSVNYAQQSKNLILYPNPVTDGKLNIKLGTATMVTLLNDTGKIVWNKSLKAGLQQVDLSLLPKGIYLVKAAEETQVLLLR